MSQYEIKMKINGEYIPLEKLREIELERSRHVLNEMTDLGYTPVFRGKEYTKDIIAGLDFDEAHDVLDAVQKEIGPEGLRELYREKIAESDDMWRQIAAESVMGEDIKPAIAELEATGVSLQDFVVATQQLASEGRSIEFANPEHFTNKAKEDGTGEYVMETMGMYGEPSYMIINTAQTGIEPIPKDADTTMAGFATGNLVSDGTEMKICGMHQYKVKPEGINVKMCIGFPGATPDELVEGHKWHLAVEFYNMFDYVGKVKYNL